jgi:hypothetical protein
MWSDLQMGDVLRCLCLPVRGTYTAPPCGQLSRPIPTFVFPYVNTICI